MPIPLSEVSERELAAGVSANRNNKEPSFATSFLTSEKPVRAGIAQSS
jgi:hypothetical protein